jgi:hypothetical protein
MTLYGQKNYDNASFKRAVVRYFLTASKQPRNNFGELPASAMQARANLDKLRRKDLQTVEEAERYFFVP